MSRYSKPEAIGAVWISANVLCYMFVAAMSESHTAYDSWGWDDVAKKSIVFHHLAVDGSPFGWHPILILVLVLVNLIVAAIFVLKEDF